MLNRRLTTWHWLAISFAGLALIAMLELTTKLMPSREDADRILFMKTLRFVQKIDPIARDTYISDLADKYMYPKGREIGYMEAVEAIAKDYPSPEFKQELDRLKSEREHYLANLSSEQTEALSSTVVAWFLFMVILNGGGFIVIHIIKWAGSQKTKSGSEAEDSKK